MIKTPVRGMRDILPSQMILRDWVMSVIVKEAIAAGFCKIETPMMESLENLTSKVGGENESLIFRVMKRGQSLMEAKEKGLELADAGMRYDLTVPLARYFANNQKDLSLPFKALQIGPVWRADRPQKGRFRQFVQCDMDILGDASMMAELDIILTIGKILEQIFRAAKIEGLKLRINDRRILTAALKFAGFNEEDKDRVLIILDKNDKIGMEGVYDELIGIGYNKEIVERFVELFDGGLGVREFCQKMGGLVADEVVCDLEDLIAAVGAESGFEVAFDATLVRGMGYYTGLIFECEVAGFGSSVAGGGRYDEMVGKMIGGGNVPACGFSIGFERIVTILEEKGFLVGGDVKKCVILVERGAGRDKMREAVKMAAGKRAEGEVVSIVAMNRNIGHQIEGLKKMGFEEFLKVYK